MKTANQPINAPKRAVPAVARAVRLLDLLAQAETPVSLATLTRQLELPKSSVHALCATLLDAGLLTRFENGTYDLGLHIMDLAHAFLARTDLTTEFVRVWDSLGQLPEETIMLGVLDGADVVYVACRNGSRPLGINFRIGARLPASATADGKALLSTLPTERVKEIIRIAGLRSLTKKSVSDVDVLLKQLAQIRKRGYSIDDEETREGMICIGAPVFDRPTSEAVAGVAVSMAKAAMNKQKRTLAIQAVKRLAETLSRRLGAAAMPAKS